MADQNEAPKIHIDSDWKAEARAEKQRLAEKAKDAGPSARGQIPPASFEALVSTMANPALLFMGLIPTQDGRRVQQLDLARHHIDMLGVLEKKSKGNLTEEEQKMLSTTLYELRNTYIQISNAPRNA